MQLKHKPLVLIVLDGFGYSEDPEFNAIRSANTPNWDNYWTMYPHMLINASGTNVGLPGDLMGNSEVGHMNIGSGRVILQDLSRIDAAIDDGTFFKNRVLSDACSLAAEGGHALHIMGLLSDGGVHSHQQHITALLEIARACGVGKVYVHAFLDGRDTPPKSAAGFIRYIEEQMASKGLGRIASICGRYYAMDRNNNWDRTARAYQLVCNGRGEYRAESAAAALREAYERGETDEFVKPTSIDCDVERPASVLAGDVVIFANFRADRARQLSAAITDPGFEGFDRGTAVQPRMFISMTRYKDDFKFPVAFPTQSFSNVFGEYVSRLGLKQLRIAETEKYAHVTFFFNGGEERVFDGEERILVPSPDVPTYDRKPEMSAPEVTDRLVEAIRGGRYDVIICNFANADMVGHTGDFEAAVRAIETIDSCLARIVGCCRECGGEVLITSDHGNAERMREPGNTAEKHTAHTNNPVPLLYIGRPAETASGTAALCDIAPTMLHLMGLQQPGEMTGRPLLRLLEEKRSAAAGS